MASKIWKAEEVWEVWKLRKTCLTKIKVDQLSTQSNSTQLSWVKSDNYYCCFPPNLYHLQGTPQIISNNCVFLKFIQKNWPHPQKWLSTNYSKKSGEKITKQIQICLRKKSTHSNKIYFHKFQRKQCQQIFFLKFYQNGKKINTKIGLHRPLNHHHTSFWVFVYLFQWYEKVNSTNSPTSPTSHGKVWKANINKKRSVAH